MLEKIRNLLKSDSFSGILLLFAAFLALFFENIEPLSKIYNDILHFPISVGFGKFHLNESLHFWINDGLMALFFFIVGLELKREMLVGQLKHFSQVFLPVFAAIGGVICPAIIFACMNHADSFAIRGWAIPTATDIAFAVGVIALLGKRVPTSLKIFVLTLAIMDDLCAIIIIALFYSSALNILFLVLSFVSLALMFVLNKFGVSKKLPYIILAFVTWAFVLNSGIHSTIAGVATAFAIPLTNKNGGSMLHDMEEALGGFVNFLVLPLFAFTNSGVSFKGLHLEHLLGPVPLGIAFGLFFGKQIGIFLFSFIAIKLKFAYMPERATWLQLYAIGIICGIGFTMSLFVNNLAYNNSDLFHHTDKLAILIGSIISGLVGYFAAKFAAKRNHHMVE